MGAGLAGVTTAWYLAKEGHEVVVLDREPEVAAAASYANTGIIAASRAFPWQAGEIGRTLRRSALRADFELSLWGLQHLFLRTGGSYRRVLEAKVRLVRYSQQELHALVAEIGFKGFTNGVLYLYRDAEALDQAWERSAVMRERGFTVERLERAQLAQHEPALDPTRLAGALYAPVRRVRRLGRVLPRARGALPHARRQLLSRERDPVDRAARCRHPRSGDAQGPDARRRLRLRARRDGPPPARAARHPRAGVSGDRLLGHAAAAQARAASRADR